MDAVWRAQIEAYVDEGHETAGMEVMWDIEKCYENVSHAKLVEQASKQSYPIS